MIAVAVARGCRHYSNYARGAHIDASQFTDISDEELSVGLLHSSLPYNPAFIRIASQLLSGPNVIACPQAANVLPLTVVVLLPLTKFGT